MTKIKTITAALCASLAVGCVLETERFGSYPPVEAGLHPPVEVGEYELAVGMATQWHMADTFREDRAAIEAIDLTTVGVSHHADIQAACGSANPNLGGCYFRTGRSIRSKRRTGVASAYWRTSTRTPLCIWQVCTLPAPMAIQPLTATWRAPMTNG